jgi:hypothetical protein
VAAISDDVRMRFPPMPDPPAGLVVHVEVDRIGGIGPWDE